MRNMLALLCLSSFMIACGSASPDPAIATDETYTVGEETPPVDQPDSAEE